MRKPYAKGSADCRTSSGNAVCTAVTTMSRGDDRFAAILKALAADPTTEFGQRGARVDTLRTIDGRFSTVGRVRIQTPLRTTHAYLKIMKPRGMGEAELARVDRMLKREYR